MLVDSYSPKNLSDIVGREKLLEPLIKSVRVDREIPHILLEGFQGTGKSTTAFAIRNELYGDNLNDSLFFELNASKNNGIDFIREQVNTWAQLSLPDAGYKHRIIFLDEADHLTTQAQAVLRRVMEDYSKTCRFIIACNFKEKLLAPIISRCQVYSFTPIEERYILAYIKWICNEERVKAEDATLKAIVQLGKGDMRQTLNILEQYMNGKDVTLFEETLLTKDLPTLIELTYKHDCDMLMSKLFQELVHYAKTLPKYDLSEAFMVLSDYDLKCSMSKLKALQVQAAFIHIKQIFQKAKSAVK